MTSFRSLSRKSEPAPSVLAELGGKEIPTPQAPLRTREPFAAMPQRASYRNISGAGCYRPANRGYSFLVPKPRENKSASQKMASNYPISGTPTQWFRTPKLLLDKSKCLLCCETTKNAVQRSRVSNDRVTPTASASLTKRVSLAERDDLDKPAGDGRRARD